ncbi:hypothetical protein BD626DRAFT_575715 [Schizophyllum amplum]|uniref:CxC2-like cysteine cluster KDZ transposase-associated domain-containing protein n=1 Tax=Schizophyllum amplum TaxID=97359 RepID=A0A550BV12_9AGAR|nr:hypothetical protein BD626DRAFT_575715 [Auriculariopsis ampla]
MRRGRPRKNDGVWDDFDITANPIAAPNLSYTIHESGDRVDCTAHDFEEPARKKRKIGDLNGAHAGWRPVPRIGDDEASTDYDFPSWATDWAASGDGQGDFDAGWDNEFYEVGSKRFRQGTVDPMQTWLEHCPQQFIDELQGVRPSYVWTFGNSCRKRRDTRSTMLLDLWGFYGRWSGEYWEKVSLSSLGYIYQLGHGGLPCAFPQERVRTMVVLDRAIHTVRYQYCGCRLVNAPDHVTQLLRNRWFPATVIDPETCATFEVLDFFRTSAVCANVNAHNFIKILEKQTDALRLNWVADREKALWRMARQYAFLMRLKRAGRAHVSDGIQNTTPGELAVRCWACPREGYNLPDDWETMDEKDKYRFQTILAVDANFRLKNRMRKNERSDCALGDGLGFFVETAPYEEHVKGYVSEKDISSCIAFQALAEKDTKFSTGLRVSGVVGVICARHELLQPHGLADLQKGERYCNVDYVLCSAIQAIKPPSRVVVSYDIGCQYSINFDERMNHLPESLRIDTDSTDVAFGLPHLSGVGRTDGEGIERIWALMNAWAWATKEMGQGARHGWLDEKGDSINFLKNIQQGSTLLRRLVISTDERDIQVKAFKAVNDNVEAADRREWKRTLRQWEKTREGQSPFAMPQLSGVSEADVRHQLDAEEMEAVKSGEAKVHGISQTSFLVAGLQLEAAQRRILADLKGPAVIPMNLEGIINSRRRALLVKLEKYHELQKLYMPGLATYLEGQAHSAPQAVDAELVPLHLPSSIPTDVRSTVCAEGLAEKELKLRSARSNDTIDGLRKKLHAKQYHIEFRNKHVTGQRGSTRHRALIATLQEKLEFDATTYRVTRQAILDLSGLTEREDLPELRARDLQLEGEMDEPDAAAMARYAGVGSTQRPRHIHVSTGKHQMSWLWTARGSADGPNDEEVRQTIGCLWLKALARKARWTEEVELLREDMRRCLRSLEKESSVWRARALALDGRTAAHNSGKAAYALRQAAQWTRLRDNFLSEWNKPYGKTKRMIFEQATSLMDDQARYIAESRAILDLDDDLDGNNNDDLDGGLDNDLGGNNDRDNNGDLEGDNSGDNENDIAIEIDSNSDDGYVHIDGDATSGTEESPEEEQLQAEIMAAVENEEGVPRGRLRSQSRRSRA